MFVGREQERTLLRDRLARVIAYGEMMGPLSVVTGARGLGKTSLLADVGERAARDGFVVAWVSGIKHQRFLPDVVDRVTRSLERADVLGTDSSRPARRVKDLGVEVNLGVGKVSATVGLDEAKEAATSPALVGPVEDFFHHTANLARDRGGAGLLVVIDELHEPLTSRAEREYIAHGPAVVDAGVLLNAAQNMSRERERYPVGFIGAGLPQTKALLMRAATFGERTREVALTGLDEQTAKAVLTEPAKQLDVSWSADVLDMAHAESGGYPPALQTIGEAAWHAARPERGDVITLEHVTAAQPAVRSEMTSLFQARWDVATDGERDFLRAMASQPGTEVRRGDVAEELGKDSDDLGMVRRSLINKGIIDAPARGRLRFTIPGFGEFVRSQRADSDDEQGQQQSASGARLRAAREQLRERTSHRTARHDLPRHGPTRGGPQL
ncbi:AAA family ATPase [Georgenia deserti]|uniref:AAA family ATPase n=1 Tax=Georgenia deserti TaxID=2093781 RepID=A0ABW4KZP1_9MICO